MFRRLGSVVASLSIVVGMVTAVVDLGVPPAAAGGLGTLLRTLNPTPSGNGRAVAFDPTSRHLFYTNYITGINAAINVIDTSGNTVATLTPTLNGQPVSYAYGALSWDPVGGVLWGGRYDGSGAVDKIDPATGVVTAVFGFAFPNGGNCFSQSPGYIDGLAFDPTDGTLWLSDDGGTTIYHVNARGSTVASFPVPAGVCNTGIAVSGQYLWLGSVQNQVEVARVSKFAPSTIISSFTTNGNSPEGIALDNVTFPGTCVMWANYAGGATTIQAWSLESDVCQGVGVVPEGSLLGADLQGGGSLSEPSCNCTAGDPVQLATGDYVEKVTDLTVSGSGLPLQFRRTYDSLAAQQGRGSSYPGSASPDVGFGWFDNLDMTVSYYAGTQLATVTEENGAQLTFQYYGVGAPNDPPWCPSDASVALFCPTAPRMLAQLVQNGDGSWTFTRRTASPLTFNFNSAGTLTGMSDAQGDTVTSGSYTGASCPSGDTCTAWSEPTAADSLVVAAATVSGAPRVAKVFELSSGITATFNPCPSTVAAWGYNYLGQLGNNQSGTFAVKVSGLSGVTAVAGGRYHSLALKSDGTVWAWGYNGSGELGNNSTTNSSVPVQVSGLSGVTAVAAGTYLSLALKSDGTVWAWGENLYGQLGNNSTTNSSVPVQVSGLSGVTVIAAGGSHSLALKSDGTVWAWGHNGNGELGNNSTTNSSVPVQVSGLNGVTAIAGGGYHSLALKTDGTVWAWGYNADGELGNNSTTSSSVPVQISGLTGVTAVAGGSFHSLALKSDGTVWAWGNNADGELGNNSTTNSSVPVQVSGLSGATAIAGGYLHSLALKWDGTVWAWGYNADGELGNNSTTNSSVPVQVSGLSAVTAIAAGSEHSLALKSDTTVWAWGAKVTAVAGGGSHSLALKSDGTVWAWGYNYYGQLGNNSTTNSSVPVQVSGLSAVTAIAAGGGHSLALKSDSTVWAWGYNDYGQLGNNSTTNSSMPVQVIGLSGVTAIVGSEWFHSLALKSDGTAWGWGYNYYGQLGNNSTANSSVPVQVSGLSGVTAIAAGGYHSLAVQQYGMETCSATDPGNLTASYTYSGSNQLLTMTPPSGAVVTNTYSGNQVSSQCITPGTGLPELMTFSYAADSTQINGSDTTITTYPMGAGGGCSVSGAPPTDTAVYKFSNDVLAEEDKAGAPKVKYQIDPTTLLPTTETDGDSNSSSVQFNNYRTSGSQFTSADPTLQTDSVGNASQLVSTAHNLVWCKVDSADFLRGVRCPSTEPAPPGPGASYPYPGVALSWFDASDHQTASTDALGNTTTYAYTSGVTGVPNGLRYCSVDPVDYQKSVTCPAYGAAHVTGTQTETFDPSGHMLSSTDRVGSVSSSCYYYQTTTCAASAPSGGSGGNPQLLYSSTDPDGTVTTYTYDQAGHVLTSVQAFRSYTARTVNAYTAAGQHYCTIAPLAYSQGHTACPTPPPSAAPAAGTNPWPGAAITIFDQSSRPLFQVSPLGGVTALAYDGTGAEYCTVTPIAYAAGTTCPASPPSSPPTPSSDPYLGATINSYDNTGRLAQETSPLGGITLYSYDGADNTTQEIVESNNSTSAPNVTTVYGYDADNRVTSTTVNPTGSPVAKTLKSYDPNGNVYCQVAANAMAAGASAYQCPAWQPGWIAAPPSPSSLYSTTPSSTQANNVSTTFHDGDGRLAQSTDADVATTIEAYDPNGQATCKSDSVNVAPWLSAHASGTYPYMCPSPPLTTPPAQGSNPGYTTTIYDVAGRTQSSTDQAGDTTSYQYDPAGHPSQVSDPRGKLTTSCYYWQSGSGQCAASAPTGGGSGDDLWSQTTPATTADPVGETTTHSFYPGGNANAITTPAGTTTDNYDGAGDLTSVVYSNTAAGYSAPGNQAYTYNPDGSRKTMTDATGTTTYTPNAIGDVTSTQFSAATGSGLTSSTVSYTYFSTGALASVVYPNYGTHSNPTTNYAYDALGNMASETDWLGNTIGFAHDGDGNLTAQNNAVSTSNPTGTSNTAFSYDNADLHKQALSTMTQTCSGSAETLTQSFSGASGSRNANGQVTQDSESYANSCSGQGSYQRNYSYDIAGRVVYQGSSPQGASANNIGYDPAGDPTTIASHDAKANLDTYTQSFDNAGEAQSQQPIAGSQGVTTTYGYDSLGDRSTATTGSSTVSYANDQAGHLSRFSFSPTSVAAGDYHSVGLEQDGSVWAWGYNAYGQLGTGSTTNSSVPVQVAGLARVTAVAAGAEHSMALNPDATVRAWGQNSAGQLGNNSTANSSVPVAVTNLIGVSAIAAGGDHSLALKSDGTVWAWGNNANGQLGNNSTTSSSVPVQVSSLSGVTAIAGGYNYSLARKSDGTVWAWGGGAYGQLGNHSTKDSKVPVQVSNLTGVTAIAAGGYHGLALRSDGTVWSWGNNVDGQLGNNSTKNSSLPVQVTNLAGVTAIAGGGNHSVALKSDRTVWTWGYNVDGQLGNNSSTNSLVPVQASGLSGATAIAGGGYHSIAVKSDGTTWTWGYNNNGQLGNGSTTTALVPVQSQLSSSSSYLYNGDGLEAGKTSAGTTATLLWGDLGSDRLPLLLSDGTNDYIYGPTGTPVEQVNVTSTPPASNPSFMTYTPSDSSWLTTNAAGNQTGFYRYDAFGNLALGTPTSPFGYAGQYQDATPLGTGFSNMRARWYDPQSGQFASRDPAFSQTNQAYAYAGDDPISGFDPTGLCGGFFSVVCSAVTSVEHGVSDVGGAVEQGLSDVGPAVEAGAEDLFPLLEVPPPSPPKRPTVNNRSTGGEYLYHYTTEAGMKGILSTGVILASKGQGRRAIHGPGVYMTDLDSSSAAQGDPYDMSIALYSTAYVTQKVRYFVEIDVAGLPVVNTGPVYPNPVYQGFSNYYYPGSMDVTGRIVNWGKVNYQYDWPAGVKYNTESIDTQYCNPDEGASLA